MTKIKISLLLFLWVSCNAEKIENFVPEITAEAQLFKLTSLEDENYLVSDTSIGIALFGQEGEVVRLEISLSGMTPNSIKAVHIHNGTLESPGMHWNQGYLFAACDSLSLGKKWSKPYIGDVGNVQIDEEGNGNFILDTDLWEIKSNTHKDLLNKIILIHENSEDFTLECSPNHTHNGMHDNPKIGGGIITLTP